MIFLFVILTNLITLILMKFIRKNKVIQLFQYCLSDVITPTQWMYEHEEYKIGWVYSGISEE